MKMRTEGQELRSNADGRHPRLGLCCSFLEAPIRFRTTTAAYLARQTLEARHAFLAALTMDNAAALGAAIDWCSAHGVGAFRINSQLLPVYTHPEVGYRLEEIDPHGEIASAFAKAGERARRMDVRLSFHPDQFVVPGSARDDVVDRSLAELEYLAFAARLVGAAQLTIHGGGAQGGKQEALERLARGLARLPPEVRALIALENDDKLYTVEDLLPLCRREGFPLVYDVHHHRYNPDDLGEAEATDVAASTWGEREPWAHISSPKAESTPRSHADFIEVADFPPSWRGRRMTVDVEAKAKELAVLRLAADLSGEARVS